MKTVLSILGCFIVMVMLAGLASAQTFTHINPPPCDFSDQFYADNGLKSAATPGLTATPELDTEPDGRFGTFRQFGPPATGSQANWVADSTNCAPTNPDERNFRILATTGGNSDDGNSPFSCFDGGNPSAPSGSLAQFGPNAVFPQCQNQPGAKPAGQVPETLEFISILAFIHTQAAFENTYSRTVGAITNGGLDGVQSNPGETISLTPGNDPVGDVNTGLNPRGISLLQIVGNFEAYASINQSANTLQCPAGATSATQCTPAPGNLALAPCSVGMIQNLQNPSATSLPQFCFNVADTQDSNKNTISDVASPKLRQNWRFATNRNAMDGSDNNCINNTDQNCKHKTYSDSPYGYFCDDLMGMWIITYFWFTAPPTDAKCGPIYQNIGNKNGFTADGYPNILTAHELNDDLEGNACGAEGQEDQAGGDHGAAWLVCPAIPDPRNGAIATDAFLDVVTNNTSTAPNNLDPFVHSNFTCLQQTGKFCFETSVE